MWILCFKLKNMNWTHISNGRDGCVASAGFVDILTGETVTPDESVTAGSDNVLVRPHLLVIFVFPRLVNKKSPTKYVSDTLATRPNRSG